MKDVSEMTQDEKVTHFIIQLSRARELLKQAVWLINTVPDFTDGRTQSHELSATINQFLKETK